MIGRLLFALTISVVIGYFVLLSSERAEGRMKTFGRILAIWLFILPVLALIGAAAHGARHDGWRKLHRGPAAESPPAPSTPQPAPQPAPSAPEPGTAPPPAK
jgi:hypothetical protein